MKQRHVQTEQSQPIKIPDTDTESKNKRGCKLNQKVKKGEKYSIHKKKYKNK